MEKVISILEIPDLNEATISEAKKKFLNYKQEGIITEGSFSDDKWCLTDEMKHVTLVFSINTIKANSLLESLGITEDEFKVYLQLITENRSGKICGAELLSRWHNPEYGILRPHEYIDILKETGQIIRHDCNIFSSVCRLLENWSKEPYDRLFLTCNFTRISLSQNDFSDHITEISLGYKFDRSRLVIEVTEDSASENSEIVSKNICRCREMGFKIAIDDMGTGFSSFADLYDNEIDLVKIGSEFISSCTSKRRKIMLSDIISLVHNSGAKVLCEGVENLDQADFLDGVNCDMMQGFYFSKILPLSECEKFLRTEKIIAESLFKK